MSALTWDNVGERYYETGVDRGVLYPYKTVNGTAGYQTGVAWNGLTAVNENPSGAEPTALYADNIKYLNLISNEEYGCTIEAYTYPDEFAECDGSAEPATGVYFSQQPRIPFGFTYRTKIGNDIVGSEKGYKIHLIYNALASPSGKSYGTINESPDAMTLSWEVTTTPIAASGFKPLAHIVIDSTKVNDAGKMKAIEDVLYGTLDTEPRLPLPDEVVTIIQGGASVGSINLNRHSATIAVGGNVELTATTIPADAEVTWSTGSSSVAEVSDGTVTGEGAGNTIITASITVDGVVYNDTCTVVVTAANNG